MDASDSTSSETALVSAPTASPAQRGRSDKGEIAETQSNAEKHGTTNVLQMYYKEFHALPSGSAIVTVGINLSPDCNYRLASGKKFQILFWDLTWENRTHTKCSWTYARFWSTNRWWWIQTWEWAYTMSTCANHIRLSSKKISFAQAVMISHVIASLASTLVQRVRESSARIKKCEHDVTLKMSPLRCHP